MKHIILRARLFFTIGTLFCGLLFSTTGVAQTKHKSTGAVSLVIEGTSNIHDWDIKSDKGTCTSEFDVNNTGSLKNISALSFSIPATSLKSKHSGMDKNTYRALKATNYSSIIFTASSVDIKPSGSAGYLLTTKGKLTIAGTSRDVSLLANGTVNPDKSITYSGSYHLKMTEYNVDPPTAMMGTIKTGDAVIVKFNMILKVL